MSSTIASSSSAMRASTSSFLQTSRRCLQPNTSSSSCSTTPTTTRFVSNRSRTPHDPSHSASARIYTPRKQFLYRSYADLLEKSQAVILFQPNNLSSAELGSIRRAVKGVPVTKHMMGEIGLEGEHSEEVVSSVAATFTVARTGLLASVIRSLPSSSTPAHTADQLSSLLSGPVALLTVPTLSPPYLKSLFAAVNKSLGYRPPAANHPTALAGSHPTSPRLVLLGALLEKNQLFSAPELVQLVQTLPEMDMLRAQLVGLLEMPARQLLGVTQQAGGGGLVRTLMGLEQGLKDGQEGPAGAVEGEKAP
jgi:large subunit ribosomal protein L10